LTGLRSLLVAAGVLLAAPAGAAAATLEADRACYFNRGEAALTGSGYAPDSQVTFTVNGRTLRATVNSDAAGELDVTYEPPKTATERRLVIRATDAEGNSGRTTIHVTRKRRVTADPSTTSNVRTWKAVFRLYGFGSGRAYIHYLNPKGRHKKTVRLGRLRGPCGRLKSDKRRVMPFKRPQFGLWRLQFDTSRRFDRDTRRARVLSVRVYRGSN
jgi:hypothetical protein